MLPLRFVSLLVLLFAVQALCKPAKSSEGTDYNDDDPPSDYKDEDQNDDEDDGEPPQILSKPENIHVRTGSTIWLNCLLKNADNYAVTWNKGDETLYYDSTSMHQSGNRITREKNNTLVIHDAMINDTSDSYVCTILKDHPLTIKHTVVVDAERATTQPPPQQQKPLVRVVPGNKVEVNAGDSITLGCETSIEPTPKIKWFHENKRVRSNVVSSGNYITIKNVNRHDAGYYRCLFETGATKPPVDAILLVVNYAPEVEVKRAVVHSGRGVESELTCIVHAHPHAKVTWTKGEKDIRPETDRIEIKSNKTWHSLQIMHTDKEDFDNYTCVAVNRLGRDGKTIRLTGIPSQAIMYGGEVTRTATGLVLKWRLESYSPITEYKLEYHLKGNEDWISMKPTVTNGKGNQYTVEHKIEGLQPGSYEAILTARNDFGWSEPSEPHTFTGEFEEEEAANVKGSPSSATSHHARALLAFFLVVTSCAFTSL